MSRVYTYSKLPWKSTLTHSRSRSATRMTCFSTIIVLFLSNKKSKKVKFALKAALVNTVILKMH